MITDKLSKIRKGELTAVENIKNFLNIIEAEKDLNAVLSVNENAMNDAKAVDKKIKKGKGGKLAGLGIIVKSNISVIDLPITCASRTLENYTGTYDADVIKKIREEDGVILGMSNMDEFACGVSGESSAFGPTINPVARDRVPGGSSSGSAAAVAAGMCDIALGSDTGGSIRNPASHCGVVGTKPSYGRVSRYGLVDLSMSLDQIGPLSKDVYGNALMLEVISGVSEYDATTFDEDVNNYTATVNKSLGNLKIGMSDDFEKLCKNKEIYRLIKQRAEEFAEVNNSKIRNVNLKYLDLAVQTYYPIVYVEFFSGTRKFDGRRYGKKIEDVAGVEVLRRIFGGREISKSEYEGKYYRKALAVRKLISQDFEKAFEKVDMIISPVTPELPHKIGGRINDPETLYAFDAFTIPASLAGICSGVVPAGKIDGIPVGIQIIAPAFNESKMLQVMKTMEDVCND